MLINKVADVDQRTTTARGNTPLMSASQEGRSTVVEMLLAHGASPNIATLDEGKTPLHTASYLGHADIVKMLINKGADVDGGWLTAASGITDYRYTPLRRAAQEGYAAVVHVLLAAGAKIWDESQGLHDVAGGISRAAVVEMKRSIDAPS
jgi:ankyrin repeat protein